MNMNQEMTEGINALRKVHGRRELRMDEAEKIAGGRELTVDAWGVKLGESEFNELMIWMVSHYGYRAALEHFQMFTKDIPFFGVHEKEPMSGSTHQESMRNLLDDYWRSRKLEN